MVVYRWHFKRFIEWYYREKSEIRYIICAFNEIENSSDFTKNVQDNLIGLKSDIKNTQLMQFKMNMLNF